MSPNDLSTSEDPAPTSVRLRPTFEPGRGRIWRQPGAAWDGADLRSLAPTGCTIWLSSTVPFGSPARSSRPFVDELVRTLRESRDTPPRRRCLAAAEQRTRRRPLLGMLADRRVAAPAAPAPRVRRDRGRPGPGRPGSGPRRTRTSCCRARRRHSRRSRWGPAKDPRCATRATRWGRPRAWSGSATEPGDSGPRFGTRGRALHIRLERHPESRAPLAPQPRLQGNLDGPGPRARTR